MIYIIHINRELGKIKRQRDTFQTKPQKKNYMKVMRNLPDKEFKVIVIKMLSYSGEEWVNSAKTSKKS